MGDKIYIITEGTYSDYHIVAVFSTEELAKEIADNNSEYRVEEYKVDNIGGYLGWNMAMDKEGSSADMAREIFGDLEAHTLYRIQRDRWAFPKTGNEETEYLWAYRVRADNREHAVKIVNEKRTWLIANNLWEVGWSSNE